MFKPIHQHVMFKLYSMTPITDPKDAKVFLLDLVDNISMVPVTEPQAVMVTDYGNEGLTGSINLATSHIAFHHWMNNGLLMLDVYSCCQFSIENVLEIVDYVWDLDLNKILFIELDRNDDTKYRRFII